MKLAQEPLTPAKLVLAGTDNPERFLADEGSKIKGKGDKASGLVRQVCVPSDWRPPHRRVTVTAL